MSIVGSIIDWQQRRDFPTPYACVRPNNFAQAARYISTFGGGSAYERNHPEDRTADLLVGKRTIPIIQVARFVVYDASAGALLMNRILSPRSLLFVRDRGENSCNMFIPTKVVGRGDRGIGASKSHEQVLELAAWCGFIPKGTSRIYDIDLNCHENKEPLARKTQRFAHKVIYSESDTFNEVCDEEHKPMILMDEIEIREEPERILDRRIPRATYAVFKDSTKMMLPDQDSIWRMLVAYRETLMHRLNVQIRTFGGESTYTIFMDERPQVCDHGKYAAPIAAWQERYTAPARRLIGGAREIPNLWLANVVPEITTPVGFYQALYDANRDAIEGESAPKRFAEIAREIAELSRFQDDIDLAARAWMEATGYGERGDDIWETLPHGLKEEKKWDVITKAGDKIGMEPFIDAALNHGVPPQDLFFA